MLDLFTPIFILQALCSDHQSTLPNRLLHPVPPTGLHQWNFFYPSPGVLERWRIHPDDTHRVLAYKPNMRKALPDYARVAPRL